jgi:tetrahydromethanopterin S-methyltransferase subunit F
MSSLFMPQCGVPTFRQTESSVVSHCAKINGYIIAVILAIVIMVFAVTESYKKWEEDKKKGNNTKDWKYIIIGLVASVVIIIFLPMLLSYFSVNAWKTTQFQIDQCVKQGRSRTECMDLQQKWEETTMQADATRQSGHDIAAAIAGSRR